MGAALRAERRLLESRRLRESRTRYDTNLGDQSGLSVAYLLPTLAGGMYPKQKATRKRGRSTLASHALLLFDRVMFGVAKWPIVGRSLIHFRSHLQAGSVDRFSPIQPPTPPPNAGMLDVRLPAAVVQHVASFLVQPSAAALACTCRRLHHAALQQGSSTVTTIDRWHFLDCFVAKGATRPLRWGCWLDAGEERRFLHAALRRYEECLSLPPSVPPPAPIIPHLIHHIWLGSPFPKRFEAWRASYRRQHPSRLCVSVRHTHITTGAIAHPHPSIEPRTLSLRLGAPAVD